MAAPRQLEARNAAASAASPAPVARLAASQLRRMRRIVDAAVELAEQGGFEAVRLRDVAERSDVALGTLYKYFRSKEDILLFALNEQLERLEQLMAARPIVGGRPYARAGEFFRRATRALARRPQFARALIRAMATGDQATAVKIAAFQLRISRLISSALRGVVPDIGPIAAAAELERSESGPRARGERSEPDRESAIAHTLMHVWFSSLVGWSAGLRAERAVVEQVRAAAKLMLDAGER
jgi:TetR/AcrR family transcriptional regulator, cholesterol catabolism regulator